MFTCSLTDCKSAADPQRITFLQALCHLFNRSAAASVLTDFSSNIINFSICTFLSYHPILEFYQEHFPPTLMQSTSKPTDNKASVSSFLTISSPESHGLFIYLLQHKGVTDLWPPHLSLSIKWLIVSDPNPATCDDEHRCSSSQGCWLRHPHWWTLELSFNKKLPPQGDFCLPQGWIGTLMVEKVLNSFLQSDPLSASLHHQWYFRAPLYLSFPSEARLKVLHHCTQ